MAAILASLYWVCLLAAPTFPDRRFQVEARTLLNLAMVKPEMDGVAVAKAALKFWIEEWSGQSFMAVGAKGPDVETMQALRKQIRGCPEPLVIPDAGRFVQEWGKPVARPHHAPSVICNSKVAMTNSGQV